MMDENSNARNTLHHAKVIQMVLRPNLSFNDQCVSLLNQGNGFDTIYFQKNYISGKPGIMSTSINGQPISHN